MEKNELKKLFQDNIKETSKLPITEHILHEKWMELNNINWTTSDRQRMYELKHSLWIPNKPNDYLQLEPEVIVADGKETSANWTMLRRMISTAKWSQSPGRFGKFLVKDKKTQTYLGVISIGSDFISIGGRDKYIGWTMKNKMDDHKLNHLCMGSSIVPTQPFGFLVGGKLIALLTISEVIEDFWNRKYKEKLAGVTTTSLYGSVKTQSQYTGLKFWHECQSSAGDIPIEPSENVYIEIKKWVKEMYPTKYDELMAPRKGGPASHVRPRLLSIAHKELGVKNVNNNFVRGVYFSELYKNTKEFLCGKNDKLGEKKFDNSVESLSDIWKKHYARKRIARLMTTDKIRDDILFYDDLIGSDFEYTKEKYLKDVGR